MSARYRYEGNVQIALIGFTTLFLKGATLPSYHLRLKLHCGKTRLLFNFQFCYQIFFIDQKSETVNGRYIATTLLPFTESGSETAQNRPSHWQIQQSIKI